MADAIDSKSIGLTPLWVQVPPPVLFAAMRDFKIAFLGTLLAAAAAAPLLAAPRRCGDGSSPRLSGDAFSPVECSTTTKTVVVLPGLPAHIDKQTVDLRDLDGRWEGHLIHALGRYELLVAIRTSWSGKTSLTMDVKELQFHERLTDRLFLVPSKQRGAYEALLTTTLAPDASLKGGAVIGAAAPAVPTPTAPDERQMDLLFENGAAHRVFFSLPKKDTLRLRAFSGIPGAPLQTFEITLTRTKREAL